MKNENQCFFSISLENGIIISGSNPCQVLDYLYEMHSAFYEMWNNYKDRGLDALYHAARREIFEVGYAIDTIKSNYKKV